MGARTSPRYAASPVCTENLDPDVVVRHENRSPREKQRSERFVRRKRRLASASCARLHLGGTELDSLNCLSRPSEAHIPCFVGNLRNSSHSGSQGLKISPVLSENHIRTYWWCNPARTGIAAILPYRWMGRFSGASFCNARCVRD